MFGEVGENGVWDPMFPFLILFHGFADFCRADVVFECNCLNASPAIGLKQFFDKGRTGDNNVKGECKLADMVDPMRLVMNVGEGENSDFFRGDVGLVECGTDHESAFIVTIRIFRGAGVLRTANADDEVVVIFERLLYGVEMAKMKGLESTDKKGGAHAVLMVVMGESIFKWPKWVAFRFCDG